MSKTPVSRNKLEPGQPRIGWLIDGDPDTPHITVQLVDSGQGISLILPWREEGMRGQYARWFHGRNVDFGDDPDYTRFRYQVPDALLYEDCDGPIALVGCRAIGMRTTFSSVGQGTAEVRFAVLGGRSLDYTSINGLRTQLLGLGEWMGIRSLTQRPVRDDHGRLQTLDLRLAAPEPTRLDRKLNLRIYPNFSVGTTTSEDTTEVRELLQLETRVNKPRPWLDHIAAHNSLRDLVDIAGWRSFGYAGQWSLRDDDPERVLSGDSVGEKWCPVVTRALRKHSPDKRRVEFLFKFPDVGATGYRRWSRLRGHYGRGINPILAHFERGPSPVETALVQCNIGFEALAFRAALDAGVSRSTAGNERHAARLGRLAREVTVPLPFEVDDWVERASDAYNGVKHANRDMPEHDEAQATLLECWILFRVWVAGRVGVPRAVLARNLENDRLVRRLRRLRAQS